MQTSFFSALILLLLVTDPLGILPICIALLRSVPPKRRIRVVIREVSIAFSVLLLFMCFGRGMLEFMHLSDVSLSIAGGIILFIIALRMIFPHPDGMFGQHTGEPFIVPLAIPLLAGPSALATVLLLVSREPEYMWLWVGALTVAMLVCAVIIIFADRLSNILGAPVLTAIERLMGLILTAIAVQMLMEGIEKFVHSL
jgi:MarC family membrane protein